LNLYNDGQYSVQTISIRTDQDEQTDGMLYSVYTL